MAGTMKGGQKAARTNKQTYGEDFYRNVGRAGGSVKNPNKGFGSMSRERVSELGKKGGSISRKNQ